MDETVTLAEGRLYRIGGSVALDGRMSAYPGDLRGFAPSNCYLLTTENAALLVDTGYTVHEELVLTGLRELLGERSSLSIFFTRPSDFESISNAGAVLSEFPVDRVFSRVAGATIVGFPPRFPAQPEQAGVSWPEDGVEWLNFAPGTPIEVEPGRAVDPITAPLRKTGSTSWLYDRDTRTLFTGDCFGHVVQASPEAPSALRPGDRDETTVADVRNRLLATFDWLEGADATTQHDGLVEFFATTEIETIAPGHGCVLTGREVVQRHVELTLAVLAEFVPVPAEVT